MSYERKSVEVEALKLAVAIYDKDGGLLADKGEWVVVDGPQQFYMRDADFKHHFSLKSPATKIKTYPVYIERERYRPIPWYGQPYVWSSSQAYCSAHSVPSQQQSTNDQWLSGAGRQIGDLSK